MLVKKFNPGTTVLLIFIFFTAAIRVVFNFSHDISPLANYSPIGAMAIFGGAYFNKKWKAFGISRREKHLFPANMLEGLQFASF